MTRLFEILCGLGLAFGLWTTSSQANGPPVNADAQSTGEEKVGISTPPALPGKSNGLSGNAAEQKVTESSPKKSVDPLHKPPVIIDKKVTYILKPLRPDGYPDYFAALNEHCRGPASTSKNAAVPLIQAFGLETVSPDIRDQYFSLLGIDVLPSVGNYFVRSQEMIERWIKGTPQLPDGEQADSLQGQFAIAGGEPWTPDEYPMVAEWLSINVGPLRLITEASQRPHFYEPIVSPSQTLPALYSVAMPLEQTLSEITLALQARAMLLAKSGKIEAALTDLLTCHRCLRLMGSMPVGQYAVETRTAEISLCQAELKLMHYGHLTQKQTERMRSERARLPPLSSLADRIDLGDRYRFLDAVCVLDRKGPAALQQLFGETSLTAEESSLQKAASDLLFDWNEPLRMGNEWFDRETAVYRKADRQERENALEQIHVDLEQMSIDAANPGIFALNWFAKRSAKAAFGRVVGASLLQLFDNETPGILNISDQLELHLAFEKTGIALAAFRAENGEYPEQLEELAPKYLEQLPTDLYSDRHPLRYRRESGGYLVYSVGPNGRDEQAGTSVNFPDSDDISIFVTDTSTAAGERGSN
jgi:hypothetical protein